VTNLKEADLVKKYGIDTKDLNAWGAKNYPQFSQSRTMIMQLYLAAHDKKVEPSDFQVITGATKKLEDLQPDEWAAVTVLFGLRLRTNPYSACPTCSKKVEGLFCQACGKVEPVTNWFDTYTIADADGGEGVAVLGPRFANSRKLHTGKTAKLKVHYTDQGECSVSQLEIIEGGDVVPAALAAKGEVTMYGLDKERVANLIVNMPVALADLKTWAAAQDPPITTSLSQLLKDIGYETDKKGILVPTKPETPVAEKAAKAVAPKKADEVQPGSKEFLENVAAEEAANLLKMVSPFGAVLVSSLKLWHKDQKIQTPLAELLKRVPHTVAGEGDKALVTFELEKPAEA